MWQMGGVGPMAGQAHHFLHYAPQMDPPQDLPYPKDRYRAEVGRLYKVLDTRLAENEYVAGDFYSIADMAIWPWVHIWKRQEQSIEGIVGDDDRCALFEDAAEQLPDLWSGVHVEGGHRLVEQHDLRGGGQGSGDRDPLGLPTAECMGSPVGQSISTDLFEPLVSRVECRLAPDPSGPESEGDIVERAQVREEQRVLSQQRDPAIVWGEPAQVLARQGDRAAVRSDQSSDHIEDR